MAERLGFYPNTKELRRLRLWHWRRLKFYCKRAEAERDSRMASEWDEIANFHLTAVQALNDVVSDTAEMDDKQNGM